MLAYYEYQLEDNESTYISLGSMATMFACLNSTSPFYVSLGSGPYVKWGAGIRYNTDDGEAFDVVRIRNGSTDQKISVLVGTGTVADSRLSLSSATLGVTLEGSNIPSNQDSDNALPIKGRGANGAVQVESYDVDISWQWRSQSAIQIADGVAKNLFAQSEFIEGGVPNLVKDLLIINTGSGDVFIRRHASITQSGDGIELKPGGNIEIGGPMWCKYNDADRAGTLVAVGDGAASQVDVSGTWHYEHTF